MTMSGSEYPITTKSIWPVEHYSTKCAVYVWAPRVTKFIFLMVVPIQGKVVPLLNYVINQWAMMAFGGADVQIRVFLKSVLVEVNGKLQAPAALPQEKNPAVKCLTGDLVEPRTRLDSLERGRILQTSRLELRPIDSSASSRSLPRAW
jgi:hypothetical protein